MRKVSRAILSVVIISLLFGSLGGVFAQNANTGVGGRPAYPREDNERSSSIFVHTLEPGESTIDGINVINNSDATKTVAVYATDSVASSGGAFACAQKVDEVEDVGSWVKLDKNSVTLEPQESEIIDFVVSVPADTEVGEYNGCIVMQGEEPPVGTDQGIGLSFRSAIRIAILVPGEVIKNLEIVDFNGTVHQDKVTLTPYIENTGNVSVDASIETILYYINGAVYSRAGGQFPVLRGETGEWNFDHNRPFWGGLFKAKVTASYDANTENYLGASNPQIKTLNYPETWILVMPTWQALIAEIFGLILVILGIKRFIDFLRFRRGVVRSWKEHTVVAGDNIKSLAKVHKITWRALARANKLKAPFTLEVGQKIKVPRKIIEVHEEK